MNIIRSNLENRLDKKFTLWHHFSYSYLWIWMSLLILLAVLFLVNLMTGSVNIPPNQIFRILLGGESESASWEKIIWMFRLPKAITAILGLARRVNNVMTLLLIGIFCGFAVNALVSVLIHFSMPERIQAFVAWTFGV